MKLVSGYKVYNKKELKSILKKHLAWLMNKKDEDGNPIGERADLSDTNLSDAILVDANLRSAILVDAKLGNANLVGARLSDADLSGAYLRGANLKDADLSDADLSDAILSSANLSNADLSSAVLVGANLIGANLVDAGLGNANLRNASLRDADLKNATLRDADLTNANLRNAINVPFVRLACPDTGSFTAWKKLYGGKIAKLLIPEDAKRSSATTNKCRASKAIVLSIENSEGVACSSGFSQYEPSFKYKVGDTLEIKDFDDDRWNECSTGIHFFINKEEAIRY